jgi:HEAT repeat protein
MSNVIKCVVLVCWVLSALPAAGQPRITNGRMTSQPVGSSLAETVRGLAAAQTDVVWIGYSIPAVDGERVMCCFDSNSTCCASCRLDPSSSTSMTMRSQPAQGGVVKLEGSGQMSVLLRVNARRVERVRVFSEDCAIDAGGRSVVWLENVRPADSVSYLEGLVGGDAERDRMTEGAVSAIALHADQAADLALERLVAPGQPDRVRRTVPFWLGNSRGRRGLDVLRRIVKEDASNEVRKKAVFGMSQSREPNAVETLIQTARTSEQASVRGEAVFWLAQKAGQKAAAAITERIEQDPDTEVKKRAVFALSQLPKDEGVPLLINVARTHTNPAVKKQAMFWLGQSKDPRAVDFFAEILK